MFFTTRFRRGGGFAAPLFRAQKVCAAGRFRHTSRWRRHIMVCKPLAKEVIIMPEQDERRTAPVQGEKREDVDDLIFRTAPGRPVSDR